MKEQTSTPWRAAAWSTSLIVAMAAIAWGMRWDPRLTFAVEKATFYLETPVELADGTLEPPVINCAVRVRFANAGKGAIWVSEHDDLAVEFNPPVESWNGSSDGTFTSSPMKLFKPGESGIRMGFRHVPDGSNRVLFRCRVRPTRRSRWKDWVQTHLPSSRTPLWLFGVLSSRESRTIESGWFEADVPPVSALSPTSNSN